MSKYFSNDSVQIDESMKVLGQEIDSIDGKDLMLLRNDEPVGVPEHILIRHEKGRVSVEISVIEALEHKSGDDFEVYRQTRYLTEAAVKKIASNTYAPGGADFQLDISDDE